MIKEITSKEINELNKLIEYKISDNPFEKCFKYVINNDLIGIIDFSDIYDRIELNYIWISPSKRGNKYSKKLMEYMIEYAKNKNNIKNITLEVSVNNSVAIKLYEKYNFKKVAKRQHYYGCTDALLMIRKFDINE